jgi:hypothetical protein
MIPLLLHFIGRVDIVVILFIFFISSNGKQDEECEFFVTCPSEKGTVDTNKIIPKLTGSVS